MAGSGDGSFRERMVIVTDDARELPRAVLLLPEMNEFRLANRLLAVPSWVIEAVDTDLDRAIAVQGVHLQRSRNEHSEHLATDVLLDVVDDARRRPAQLGGRPA